MESIIAKMNNMKIRGRKPVRKRKPRIVVKGRKVIIATEADEKKLRKMFKWYIPKRYQSLVWKEVRDNLIGEYSEYQTGQLIKLGRQLKEKEDARMDVEILSRLMNSVDITPKKLIRMANAVVEHM
jgi:hypothetical protein